MSSLPHSPGVGPTGPGICQQNRNPLVANPVLRALLLDMDSWVSGHQEPPESRLPHVADGTLVSPLPQSRVGFPNIPGVTYNGRIHTGDLFFFGHLFDQGILNSPPADSGRNPLSGIGSQNRRRRKRHRGRSAARRGGAIGNLHGLGSACVPCWRERWL
jgi:hypothetical protein